jgi:hypothetical protein
MRSYTAEIKQDAGWWIGGIEEVPGVNCLEYSCEALVETLRVTLREVLELNRQEALGGSRWKF